MTNLANIMKYVCKNKCKECKNIIGGVNIRYDKGYKKCGECRISIKTSDIRCFCCNRQLRIRNRSLHKLRKLRKYDDYKRVN